jgi:integrase
MKNRDIGYIDLDKLPLQPRRCGFVLTAILARHNWRHAVKDKGVSYDTMEDRRQFLFRTFAYLRDNPTKSFKLDPRSLSGRHVDFLFEHWQQRARAGELGPSSLQKIHSMLRTFAGWIGKPDLVKPLLAYIDDKALFKRSYVATQSKTWRSQGVDVDAMIAEVEARDAYAGAALRLMAAFGLRFKEGVMLRPHLDVYTATQAGRPDDEPMTYLHTHRGTKGGRERFVPIDTPQRRRAVDVARAVARSHEGSVSNPHHNLVRAIRHLRYVIEESGITKAGLKVVPHGLRHQYAADEYQAATGHAPPVEGGVVVDRELDHLARRGVSNKLGHNREQIVKAYLGQSGSAAPPPAGSLDVATSSESSLAA